MDILENIENDIKFTKRATPIPFGTRISYRVAQICLILSFCNGGRASCSMMKLQTISNTLFKPQDFEYLIKFTRDRALSLNFVPRIDPCVNIAVGFALKYGLCQQASSNKRYKLTRLGQRYAYAIREEGVMQYENNMLSKLGTDFTEDMLNDIINYGVDDVKDFALEDNNQN